MGIVKLRFRSNVRKNSHRRAARMAGRGVGKWFRSPFNEIVIKRNLKTGSYAYTTRYAPKTMKISYNPNKHKSRSKDRRIGKLTQTFSHELFVHARRDLKAERKGTAPSSGSSDHRRMHSPTHRDSFLSATRRTFKQLENRGQKVAFAESFAKDLINEIDDAGLSKTEAKSRKKWARQRRDSMIHAIDNPQTHSWT